MRFNDIVLGDANVPGITDTEPNGIVRLSGANERLRAQAINNYKYPKTVYGNQIDNDNAKAILGTTGYNYRYTDSESFIKPTSFTSNDIILGGPTATGILDSELSGAIIRLCGADKIETANLVRNYSAAKNVFGMSIDVQNAKRYLGTIDYNYIEIDQTGFIKPSSFSCNDIILGSDKFTNILDDELNGAIRYYGNDRYETAKIIKELVRPKYVIGAEPDYTNVQSILGTTGEYGYKNITEIPSILDSTMIVLGGPKVTGITDKQLNGALRLWGDTEALTAQAINNYNSPKYVYGAQVDIDNAKKILGGAGHTYVVVSNVDSNTTFSYNDIVLGGPEPTGITDDQLKGAMRIWGANSVETASAIQNYSKSKNVYGAKVDIDNAREILKGIVYNYIDTDFTDQEHPALPMLTCNDIILGGIAEKVNSKGVTKLKEDNRDLTAQAIMDYAHVPDLANESWGNINTSNMLVPITIDGTNGETTTIPINTKVQIYSSDGDYYDCYYSGTSGVKILKMYLTETTAPTTPGTGGNTELERFCEEPITSTWGISNSTAEGWFLQQNTAQPVIQRYGLNSTNIKDVTAALEAAGVSPVFFYAYTVNEGGGEGGFINHWGKSYYKDNGGDTAINAATGDAQYLATESKNMYGKPAWTDCGENYVDFVPQDVKNRGNASFANMPSGSIGRAYIAATAATTWEVYYPNGLLKDYNKVQNYGAPMQGVMNAIKAMGGNP